jgi:hypothetical protein
MIIIEVMIQCDIDYCLEYLEGFTDSEAAINYAKSKGWIITNDAHICKKHPKDTDETRQAAYPQSQ